MFQQGVESAGNGVGPGSGRCQRTVKDSMGFGLEDRLGPEMRRESLGKVLRGFWSIF